jgi:hypothetical protein
MAKESMPNLSHVNEGRRRPVGLTRVWDIEGKFLENVEL